MICDVVIKQAKGSSRTVTVSIIRQQQLANCCVLHAPTCSTSHHTSVVDEMLINQSWCCDRDVDCRGRTCVVRLAVRVCISSYIAYTNII